MQSFLLQEDLQDLRTTLLSISTTPQSYCSDSGDDAFPQRCPDWVGESRSGHQLPMGFWGQSLGINLGFTLPPPPASPAPFHSLALVLLVSPPWDLDMTLQVSQAPAFCLVSRGSWLDPWAPLVAAQASCLHFWRLSALLHGDRLCPKIL